MSNSFLSFLAIMLIQGHHGRIPSPSTVVKRIEEHRNELEQQFKNLLHTEELDAALNCESLPNFLNAKSVLNDYNAAAFHNKLKIPFDIAVQKHEQSLKPYFIANMLFSILIDADRLDAADLDVRKMYDMDPQLIANYINGIKKESLQKFGDKLNSIVRLRSYVLRSVLEKLAIARNNRVFSLTAPTGSGKTLTFFLFANMLRHGIYQETKRRARIIYVLPFLSIIDQNAKVIQEALELKHGWQPV